MKIKNAAAVLFIFLFLSGNVIGQTAKQWSNLASADSARAADILVHSFADERWKAIDHYRKVGNKERAEIVEKLHPNVGELIGRLELVARTKPDANVADVMRGYIIDASAELLKQKASPSK